MSGEQSGDERRSPWIDSEDFSLSSVQAYIRLIVSTTVLSDLKVVRTLSLIAVARVVMHGW